GGQLYNHYKIGDRIKLSRDDLNDHLLVDEVVVVGLVDTNEYLNQAKGNSTLNNKNLSSYFYMKEDSFKSDIYTYAAVVLKDAKKLNAFNDEYANLIDKGKQEVSQLAIAQEKVRADKIIKEAKDKYQEGLDKYNNGVKEIETNEDKIKESEIKIREGETQLKTQRETLDKMMAQGETQISEAEKMLDKATVYWQVENDKFYQVTKPALEKQKSGHQKDLQVLNEKQKQIIEIDKQINEKDNLIISKQEELIVLLQIANPTPDQITKISNLKIEIEFLKKEKQGLLDQKMQIFDSLKIYGVSNSEQLNNKIKEKEKAINDIDNEIKSKEGSLKYSKTALDEAGARIVQSKKELIKQKENIELEMDKAQKQIESGKRQLITGKEELEKGKFELNNALKELKKAEADIAKLENGKWTILTHKEIYGITTFHDTIGQMKAIAAIFPVFFFLVAALVCLTTMTRMVDEQRGQIGTLRALGYTKLSCSKKYLIYAGLASVVGGIFGSVIGMFVFPSVIYNAWNMMFVLPPVSYTIPWLMIFIAIIGFVILILGITYYAVLSNTKEVASQLLRPKAPSMGKKILLERVTIIWNRFSFSSKVTARNIFRYKKRFFMTIIGVAGCSALLVAGFGIKDSITEVIDVQFKTIYKYDGMISLKDDLSIEKIEDSYQQIKNIEEVKKSALLTGYSSKVNKGGNEEVASVLVFDDDKQAQEFNVIRKDRTHETINLNNNGVIISKKMGELLDVKKGDKINVESQNGIVKEVLVNDIFEMYVQHHVYMTSNYYQQIFGFKNTDNVVLISSDNTDVVQQALADNKNINSFNFFAPLIENFDNMVSGLNIIVIVLVVSAGLLAFVVLSNLTNVNLSERQREIATLKVLGFNNKEVKNYIFRENLLLSIIGGVVGLGLGIILHRYIMLLVEMDYVMFGRLVKPMSLVYALLITIGFSLLINFTMAKKLRGIKMIESLKSVE
ncbi:MAG: FtsX-like permease family protein, partial [Erysipelotrichaceae bacterium]